MGRFEKIAVVENEIEAISLREELEERRIPHMVQSHYDSAYDGLFQFSGGWGHVEAPVEHRDEILAVLVALRQHSSAQHDEKKENTEGG